jgi:hypothetical protein
MMQGGREHGELQGLQPEEQAPLVYDMRGMGYSPEDILLCVDADAEVNAEMKAGVGVKGLSRLDAVKQALVLFVHSKLLMHSQHRFAVATLRNNAVWVRLDTEPSLCIKWPLLTSNLSPEKLLGTSLLGGLLPFLGALGFRIIGSRICNFVSVSLQFLRLRKTLE